MADELTQTEALLKLAQRFQLSELEWQEEGLRIFIRRETTRVDAHEVASIAPGSWEGEAGSTGSRTRVAIRAPMTGVFYRASSPDVPPYVEVGDVVEEQQTVCLIEAMKVFNEIPAERSGRVVEICASSGQLVEQGTVLFWLEPEEAEA